MRVEARISKTKCIEIYVKYIMFCQAIKQQTEKYQNSVPVSRFSLNQSENRCHMLS